MAIFNSYVSLPEGNSFMEIYGEFMVNSWWFHDDFMGRKTCILWWWIDIESRKMGSTWVTFHGADQWVNNGE